MECEFHHTPYKKRLLGSWAPHNHDAAKKVLEIHLQDKARKNSNTPLEVLEAYNTPLWRARQIWAHGTRDERDRKFSYWPMPFSILWYRFRPFRLYKNIKVIIFYWFYSLFSPYLIGFINMGKSHPDRHGFPYYDTNSDRFHPYTRLYTSHSWFSNLKTSNFRI